MNNKIAIIGENLVDLFKVGKKFEAHPGGSPLNVAVGLARLGENVSYITKFSSDFFGKMLINVLKSEGVNLSFCSIDKKLHTTLAFAFVDENKVPTFEIWNRCTADSSITWEEISKIDLNNFDVIHFGSILLATPAANAILKFVKKAKKLGKFITFDPNYRPKVAVDEKNYLKALHDGWKLADVVKCSFEDAKILFDLEAFKDVVKTIKTESVPTLLTMGSKGAYVIIENEAVHIPAYKTRVVDTTGCGDAFAAGMIHNFFRHGFSIEINVLVDAARFGNATAAIAAQKIGAITSFAHANNVEEFMKGVRQFDENEHKRYC